MSKVKDVLTTGEVARLCNVAPRTVSKWFDTGQLRGYRIPGSKDRRIPLHHLIRFMKIHGMPMNGLESDQVRVLIVDPDEELTDLLRQTLTEKEGYSVQTARSAFEAGASLQDFRPSVVFMNIDLAGFDVTELSRFVTTQPDLHRTVLVAVSATLTPRDRQVLRQQGYRHTLSKPYHLQQVIDVIEDALETIPA